MSIKVEKTENKDELKLEFTVEAKVFEDAMKKVFSKNAKYFNIPGFRKGKAPMNIVEKFYGAEIFYEDAFNDIVPSVFDEGVKEEKIDVVSRPKIDIVQIGKGKELIFTAIVQVKPEVKLGKYKGIELEKTVYKVTDEAIDNEINKMAERNSRMISISDRPAQKDDTAVIDFAGTIDGVAFDGGTSENHELKLGSNTFIPGFEDQVIGMKTGEEKDVKVKFPDDYFSKDLAGKDAVFKVKVNEIKAKELPKIDDEFAKDVSEFDTLKELKADTKKKLQEELDNKSKSELDETAVKSVSDIADVEIPSGMVELEIDGIIDDMNRRLSYQGIKIDQYLQILGKTMEEFRKENEETARANAKMKLVLEAVYKDAKLEVSDEEIQTKLEELATMYGRKVDDVKDNEELNTRIRESLESEKAIKFIVDNAKIKEISEEEKNKKLEKEAEKKNKEKAETKKDSEEKKSSKKSVKEDKKAKDSKEVEEKKEDSKETKNKKNSKK